MRATQGQHWKSQRNSGVESERGGRQRAEKAEDAVLLALEMEEEAAH